MPSLKTRENRRLERGYLSFRINAIEVCAASSMLARRSRGRVHA